MQVPYEDIRRGKIMVRGNKPMEEKKIYPQIPYPKWMIDDIGKDDENDS